MVVPAGSSFTKTAMVTSVVRDLVLIAVHLPPLLPMHSVDAVDNLVEVQ